jgi:hypothetical protein
MNLAGTKKIAIENVKKGMFVAGRGIVQDVSIHVDEQANRGQARQPKKDRFLARPAYDRAIANELRMQTKPAETGRVTVKGVGFQLVGEFGTEVEIFEKPNAPPLMTADQLADNYNRVAA